MDDMTLIRPLNKGVQVLYAVIINDSLRTCRFRPATSRRQSAVQIFLQYFDIVGWAFWPVKTVSRITYTVLVGT